VSDTAQTIDSTQAQAIPALIQPVKRRKSIKAPMVKAAVISKRTQGHNISSIAKDLGITRNTTRTILAEANFDQEIEAGRISCVKLIGKGAQAIEKAFDRGDGALAVRMFEGLGILGNSTKTGNKAMQADLHLQQAINVLIQPHATPSKRSNDVQVIESNGMAESMTFEPSAVRHVEDQTQAAKNLPLGDLDLHVPQ